MALTGELVLKRISLLGAVVCVTAAVGTATASAADQIAYECSQDICTINPDSPLTSITNLTHTPGFSEQRPSYSPDGNRLAYAATYPDAGAGGNDIYTVLSSPPSLPATATNVSQSPDRNAGLSERPVWSPDGTRIAYAETHTTSNTGLFEDVYVSPADGSSPAVPIGSTTGEEVEPTWSPDGTKVAFNRDGVQTYIGAANGSATPTALAGSIGSEPSWSPDGTRIATARLFAPMTNQYDIRITRVDGSGFFDLQASQPTAPYGTDGEPVAWSPDSSKIAYQTNNNHLRVVPSDGSGPGVDIPLGVSTGSPGSITWSPDGTRLAFMADDFSNANGTEIYLVQADGTQTAHSIASVAGDNDGYPVFKPGPRAVIPPVTPPITPTRPVVTINLAKLGAHGPINPHVLSVSIACHVDGFSSDSPACKTRGDGFTTYSSPQGSHRTFAALKPKKKKVLVVTGSATIPSGTTGTLKLKITKAGLKALKPGRTYKMALKIQVASTGLDTVTQSKTVKIKLPPKHGH